MCGINGITRENAQAIQLMSKATAHRGPDAVGFYSNDGISFSHNRLSIIDLSVEANQPMQSPDGRYVLVFNGEIYNYRELRAELSHLWQFKTQGDSEVLLAGFIHWGDKVLNKLRGIFAFAIWDTKESSLLLVRDQMGVKPLYYTFVDKTLYFSSELSGIVAGTNQRKISVSALQSYLSVNYVPSPDTFIEGIHKLRPGYLLKYKNGISSVQRYWSPLSPTKSTYDAKALFFTIDKSIQRQLVSDRPVGVLLSGGLDSSIILHHTSKYSDAVKTFSVDFEMVTGAEKDASKFNSDAVLAEMTAKHYGALHTTFTLSLEDIRKNLESSLLAIDEPTANPTFVSRYLLSKLMRERGIVVALGGDGADELFGGYIRNRIVLLANIFQKSPFLVQKILAHASGRLNKLTTPIDAQFYEQLMFSEQRKNNGALLVETTHSAIRSIVQERYQEDVVQGMDGVDSFMRVDRELWLADESLAQTDRASMAHGLEVRVPFLDLDVVNFSDEIFARNKFSVLQNKKIIRDIYKGHLPEYLFNQPKRGWLSPGAKWLRDPVIKEYIRNVLSSGYYDGFDHVIDWGNVQKKFIQHTEEGQYYLQPLWNIMQLQVWGRKLKISI